MGLFKEKCGFGKRKKSVAEQKKLKQIMVMHKVRKLKAAGKPVDRQAINKEVLDQFRRRR